MRQEICDFFSFTEKRIEELKQIVFEVIDDFEETKHEYIKEIKEIELADFVGSVRWDFKSPMNLYEAYNKLHKGYLYKNKSRCDWEDIITHPINGDLPEVLKLNDKYYHCGEGKHRLITSKILGFSRIKVIVKTIKV